MDTQRLEQYTSAGQQAALRSIPQHLRSNVIDAQIVKNTIPVVGKMQQVIDVQEVITATRTAGKGVQAEVGPILNNIAQAAQKTAQVASLGAQAAFATYLANMNKASNRAGAMQAAANQMADQSIVNRATDDIMEGLSESATNDIESPASSNSSSTPSGSEAGSQPISGTDDSVFGEGITDDGSITNAEEPTQPTVETPVESEDVVNAENTNAPAEQINPDESSINTDSSGLPQATPTNDEDPETNAAPSENELADQLAKDKAADKPKAAGSAQSQDNAEAGEGNIGQQAVEAYGEKDPITEQAQAAQNAGTKSEKLAKLKELNTSLQKRVKGLKVPGFSLIFALTTIKEICDFFDFSGVGAVISYLIDFVDYVAILYLLQSGDQWFKKNIVQPMVGYLFGALLIEIFPLVGAIPAMGVWFGALRIKVRNMMKKTKRISEDVDKQIEEIENPKRK